MPAPSKQPISGLKSIKRDFSSAPLPSASQNSSLSASDASAIPWTPSPPQQQLPGMAQRLKDIQDALSGHAVASEKTLSGTSSASSSQAFRGGPPGSLKRSAPSQDPPAKRRQLPPNWSENTESTTSRTFGSSRVANAPLVVSAASSGAVAKPAPVFLSQEQQHILKLVQDGQSVFYTGSAGTGKSVLLREIIKTMKKKHPRAIDAVAVTASTGIAACNIGGITIHSFAGIGLGRESAEQLATKIRKNKKATGRWLRTQVLIIDEVSMVEGELFDKLARIGSIIRKRVEPFGGIQVIVTGDFFQLPPVTKSTGVKFAFEAELWGQTIKKTFNLTRVFRQKDPEFVSMLNEMRLGCLSDESIKKFKRLEREIIYEDGLGATELFPRREEVDQSNVMRMKSIRTEGHTFLASDGGLLQDEAQRQKMLSNFVAPQRLILKIGAQVMLIKNIDETLVNGSMGQVVKFLDPSDPNGSLDDELPGGKPLSKNGAAKPAKKAAEVTPWPVVDFLGPGSSRRRVVVQSESFKVELPSGEVQASRTQLPLILAWAMSIHKSQGQTLERVKVDLAKVFEKGQAYVALSRATSLDGLQVLHFDPAKVNAHPKVVEWSKTLETVPAL